MIQKIKIQEDTEIGSRVKLHRWDKNCNQLQSDCKMNNVVFRISWKESKWYFKNKIQCTYKLEAYGKLFHFDNQGLKEGPSGFLLTAWSGCTAESSDKPLIKSETLTESSLELGERLKPKFLHAGTEIIESGFGQYIFDK